VGVPRSPGQVLVALAACGALLGVMALLSGQPKPLSARSDLGAAPTTARPTRPATSAKTASDPMPGPTRTRVGVTTSSTFNSISLSWRPSGAGPTRKVSVRFRAQGSHRWHAGLPLVYDTRTDRPYGREYRGSLVNLVPRTTYVVQLRLGRSGRKVTLKRRTWSERYPIARTIKVPASKAPLRISAGGRPNGYALYTPSARAAGPTVGADQPSAVMVDASYVIVRGFRIRGGRNGIAIAAGAHDVVIERNDVSGWGRIAADAGKRPDGSAYRDPSTRFWGEDGDAAVACAGGPGPSQIDRVVVQGNRLHDPATASNSWDQPRPQSTNGHPFGPQAVYANDCGSNWVIRENDISTSPAHYFNDCLGGAANFSERGFPLADSDVADNRIERCHDDGIEAEGADQNVRIWGNYIDHSFAMVAVAPAQIGPIYIWRNVADRSAQEGASPSDKATRGPFLKAGSRDSRFPGGGQIFVFNNTVLQRAPKPGQRLGLGPSYGLPDTVGPVIGLVSRNNILMVPSPRNYSIVHQTPPADDGTTSFDYDLYNGLAYVKGIARIEPHGLHKAPEFVSSAGSFSLATTSPGVDAGQRIPNFTDGYHGAGPDVGAQERGAATMRFGIAASKPGRHR
jgi:hypothetical protein